MVLTQAQIAQSTSMVFLDELDREIRSQSDRGLAILALSGLDILLSDLLLSRFVNGIKRDTLFGGQGPFHEYSSKVKAAFAMGLISADEQREFNLMGRIRNSLAHELSGASFDDPKVADRCSALVLCERLFVPAVVPLQRDENGEMYLPDEWTTEELPIIPAHQLTLPKDASPRERFAHSAKALGRVVGARSLASRGTPLSSPKEYGKASDPIRLSNSMSESLGVRIDEVVAEAAAALERATDNPDLTAIIPELEKQLQKAIAHKAQIASDRQLIILTRLGRYVDAVIDKSRRAAGLDD